MEFNCVTHGSLEHVVMDGEAASVSDYVEQSARDLADVVFYISTPTGTTVSEDHIDTDSPHYMSKFAGAEDGVAEYMNYLIGRFPNRTFEEEFGCPYAEPGSGCGVNVVRECEDSQNNQ